MELLVGSGMFDTDVVVGADAGRQAVLLAMLGRRG